MQIIKQEQFLLHCVALNISEINWKNVKMLKSLFKILLSNKKYIQMRLGWLNTFDCASDQKHNGKCTYPFFKNKIELEDIKKYDIRNVGK